MTLRGYGRLTPLQCSMLELGGEVLDPAFFRQSSTEEQRKNAMRRAREQLVDTTRRDFGYDLVAWHEWLMSSSQFSKEYRHPYGWKATRKKLELLFTDARRSRLARELEAEEE